MLRSQVFSGAQVFFKLQLFVIPCESSSSQTLACIQQPLGLVKTQTWALSSQFLIPQVQSGTLGFAFLRISQTMLMLVVWEPHFEDDFFKVFGRLEDLSFRDIQHIEMNSNFIVLLLGSIHALTSHSLIIQRIYFGYSNILPHRSRSLHVFH